MDLNEWINSGKPLNSVINCDCIEGLKQIDDNSIDLVLTDPPYNVDYREWDVISKEWFMQSQRVSRQLIFTCGIRNIYEYPKPKWVYGWFKIGSTRRNDTGGFNHWEPLLYYGNNKLMTDAISLPDCVNHTKGNIHGCPKPVRLYKKIISLLSNEGDTILDPFLGSGTTAVAAINLGRRFIGMEISPKYCADAEKRISEAKAQTKLSNTLF